MPTRFARLVTAVQYQITLAFALVLLPVATLVSRLGLTLPLSGLIERSEAAYESSR